MLFLGIAPELLAAFLVIVQRLFEGLRASWIVRHEPAAGHRGFKSSGPFPGFLLGIEGPAYRLLPTPANPDFPITGHPLANRRHFSLALCGAEWSKSQGQARYMISGQKELYFAALLSWRPRRDSNPCYRRERPVS